MTRLGIGRAALLGALVAATLAAGCGRKGEAPAPNPAAAAAQNEVERRQGL
jgi:predicted small lipoprotein YifL